MSLNKYKMSSLSDKIEVQRTAVAEAVPLEPETPTVPEANPIEAEAPLIPDVVPTETEIPSVPETDNGEKVETKVKKGRKLNK